MKIHAVRFDASSSNLLIEAEIDFDQFDQFGDALARALDCEVLEKQWGADRHQWRLVFEGSDLSLHYEFYGNICWLSAEDQADAEVVKYLSTLLTGYVSNQGSV